MRKCSNKKCREVNPQPIANFYKNRKEPAGVQSECKKCHSIRGVVWRNNNIEKCRKYKLDWIKKNKKRYQASNARYQENNKEWLKKYRREYNKRNPEKTLNNRLKTTYGIDLLKYKNLLKKQKNVCSVCKKPEIRIRNNKLCRLSVDHCHTSGIVRGLLCFNCNVGLGKFKDSLRVLKSAIRYLKKEI